MYLRDCFALKPFRDCSLCSVCILPQPAFYSESAVCILPTVCILPLVRSLQSAVRSLHFTMTDSKIFQTVNYSCAFIIHTSCSNATNQPVLRSRWAGAGGGGGLIFVTPYVISTIFGVRESWCTEKLSCESYVIEVISVKSLNCQNPHLCIRTLKINWRN